MRMLRVYDGFFEGNLKPWDVAAGSLLVTEAGGLIGNFTGESDFLHQGECVAGNPKIYGQLVATLAKYSKFAGAGDKAAVRQAALNAAAAASQNEDDDAPAEPATLAAPKATLTSRRIKAVSPVAAAAPKLPDAPF